MDKVEWLLGLPEWEWVNILSEGLLQDPCAGCTWCDVYVTEWEIYETYRQKYPDAPPLM